MLNLEHLKVEFKDQIATLSLHRPEKANAFAFHFWEQLDTALQWVKATAEVRCVIIKGEGQHFSSGIDLVDFQSILLTKNNCDARRRESLRQSILQFQETFSSIETCQKPVIAQIHGACLGGALDLIAACDMRFCSDDAYFQIKEIDLGMVADLGTLQRLPSLMPLGVVSELALTGRKFNAEEAETHGLINKVFTSQSALSTHVQSIAETIAKKSPLAIRGTKEALIYSRDHSVPESLQQIALWNSAFMLSQDLEEAVSSHFQKRDPEYSDL